MRSTRKELQYGAPQFRAVANLPPCSYQTFFDSLHQALLFKHGFSDEPTGHAATTACADSGM